MKAHSHKDSITMAYECAHATGGLISKAQFPAFLVYIEKTGKPGNKAKQQVRITMYTGCNVLAMSSNNVVERFC